VVGALLAEMRQKLGIKEEEPAEEEQDLDLDEEDDYEEEDFEAENVEPEPAAGAEGEGEGEGELDAGLTALLEEVENGVAKESEAAKTARSDYWAAQTAADEAARAVRELEALEEEDFGDDQEFAALKGKCFSRKVAQYTYEICPYKEAFQKEGGNTHGTSLGKWVGMERVPAPGDGGSSSTSSTSTAPASFVFKFENGQKCWNGPMRSLKVTVTCGTEDEVLSVDEPSMCEYAMAFRTPAACAPLPDHLRLDLDWENDNEADEEEKGSLRTEL
jgi:hypothetical protein